MVNQEAGKFSVWQANTVSTNSEYVAVDGQNNVVSDFCVDSMAGSPRASSDPTSILTPSPEDKGLPLSGSAIGGIVAGAVGGIVILGTIAFLSYRRRGRVGAARGLTEECGLQTEDVKPPKYDVGMARPQELPVNQYKIAELDSRDIDGRYQ